MELTQAKATALLEDGLGIVDESQENLRDRDFSANPNDT